jgi:SAM-dependent methyltransferase
MTKTRTSESEGLERISGDMVPRTEEDTLEIIGKNEERTDKAIYRYDLKRRRVLIHKLLKGLDSRDSLLDLGCSNGSFFNFFKEEGFREIHGVELSPVRAKTARKRGYDSIFVGKGQSTPFPDRKFDVIVNQEVLVHVLRYEDRMAMIREARRLLKPGGLYILSFPPTEGRGAIRKANRLCLIDQLKGLKNRLAGRDKSHRITPSLYCRYWSGRQMESMLEEAGFEVVQRLGHLYYYPEALHLILPLLGLLDRLLYRSLPYYGSACFVSSTRP